jgi:prevent-host-death family protein
LGLILVLILWDEVHCGRKRLREGREFHFQLHENDNMTIVGDYRRKTAMSTTIGAGEFKSKCLKLLDEVAQTHETLVITKHGKPVAQVVPMPAEVDLVGSMRGSVVWEDDIISPLENEWEAAQ